ALPRRRRCRRTGAAARALKHGVLDHAWITYPSRRARDRINAKVMADPRLAAMRDPNALPFDGKRMFWGGFKTLVAL
ncbi:MAG: DUF1428 family protein, partial [Rubrivivax sp.]